MYALQIMTTSGWVTSATYPSRSTAYRYAANRRKAYPSTTTRVILVRK